MKKELIGMLAAAMLASPAWAGSEGGRGGGAHGGRDSGSSSSATGGAGGSGGSATGGSATGGAATGGSANGNTSNVTVSLSTGNADGQAGEAGSNAYNTKATVDYGGSYTVRSAPAIAAPSLTSTFSDTCMGSSSFGLSVVGFGATGGSTIVDDACVRRLDSREFRAMGLNDVALALLCQSEANRKAVEATGRSCPGIAVPTAAAATDTGQAEPQYTDPFVRRRLGLDPAEPRSAVDASATDAAKVTVATVVHTGLESKPLGGTSARDK
ncbi:histidine kinase [Herbaspirillum sp. WKF16]|uniref:histidine kinase n=1 Tax=Herbaspirillum sp. WKF16 TaxID=3028312 RepID=UPI0023A9B4A9|nr:histidine kinase [Herbaspirillum sp. WKF16]WDZ95224.1 histidine kinase [Herbaspirillum sp. WKF16]